MRCNHLRWAAGTQVGWGVVCVATLPPYHLTPRGCVLRPYGLAVLPSSCSNPPPRVSPPPRIGGSSHVRPRPPRAPALPASWRRPRPATAVADRLLHAAADAPAERRPRG